MQTHPKVERGAVVADGGDEVDVDLDVVDERKTLAGEGRLELEPRERLVERAVRRRLGVALDRERDLALGRQVLREEVLGDGVVRVGGHVLELGRERVRACATRERERVRPRARLERVRAERR